MYTIKADYSSHYGSFADEESARRAIKRIRETAPYGREFRLAAVPLTDDITPKPLHASYTD